VEIYQVLGYQLEYWKTETGQGNRALALAEEKRGCFPAMEGARIQKLE
jgi:hypothetical protein